MMSMIAPPYRNEGNELVLSLLPENVTRILDVGCGGGDNARRLRELKPCARLVGVTHSEDEAHIASKHFDKIIVGDLEAMPASDIGSEFDLLLFSHVLEHLRDPLSLVRRLLPLLAADGHVLIAVPNTLEWRSRAQLTLGRFEYAADGIFDRTHLRFFTYDSAPRELIAPVPELVLVTQQGSGAAPLGPFRRWLLPRKVRAKIDALAVTRFPNLFARETAMLARLRERLT